MTKDVFPVNGDVIVSKRFINGVKDFDPENPVIHVGSDSPSHMVSRHMTDDETVAYVQKHNKLPTNYWVEENLDSIDVTRGFAEFVVIEARMQGGGSSGYPNDDYPDGWHVRAKRLDNDGNWDDNGEEIEFYMSGCFIDMLEPSEIKIVRKMRLSFR